MRFLKSLRQGILASAICATSVALGVTLAAAETFTMAGIYPNGDPIHDALLEYAAKVEQATDGRIKVKTFPSGELGDYTNIYEEVRRGTIPMALIPVPSQFDPRLELSSLPYSVSSLDEVKERNSKGGYVYEAMNAIHNELGVKLLGGMYPVGFGGIALTKVPDNLKDPGANKDTLIRVPPMELYKVTAEKLGFQTVTINFGDLTSALQTGVADGWVGGNALINYILFRDVIKAYVTANLYYESHAILMNKQAYLALSEDDQKLLDQIATDMTSAAFDATQEREELFLQKMADEKGIQIIRFDEDETKAWAEFVKTNVWPQLEERLTPELMGGLVEGN